MLPRGVRARRALVIDAHIARGNDLAVQLGNQGNGGALCLHDGIETRNETLILRVLFAPEPAAPQRRVDIGDCIDVVKLCRSNNNVVQVHCKLLDRGGYLNDTQGLGHGAS